MSKWTLKAEFGLIRDNLDLKRNVLVEINELGKICKIDYEDTDGQIVLNEDSNNDILIPGFINSHIHIADSFAKEQGFNKNLKDIVAPPNGLKHELLQKTTEPIIVEGIKKATEEMISNGITCFIDFREGGLEGIKLLKDALMENPISHLILGRFKTIKELEDVYEEADGIGLSSYNSLNEEMVFRLKWLTDQINKSIACHCSELERDDDILNKIIDNNIINTIIHGTHFNTEDLNKIKQKNINLVLCPRSNGYFGAGFPPIIEILKLNMHVSLGTDNVMTNSLDLFEEMRYLYRIARVMDSSENKTCLSAKKLLKMVTINAARNFKLEPSKGSISENKDADFFLIDLNQPNYFGLITEETLLPLIINRTKSDNIKKVFIKGELVYERS